MHRDFGLTRKKIERRINNLFFYHILFCYVKSSRGNLRIQVKSADSSVGIDQ